MSEDTKKLSRLQTAEKYSVANIGNNDFEVYTPNRDYKAFVSCDGVIIYTSLDEYDKVVLYKLKNYCALLQLFYYKNRI